MWIETESSGFLNLDSVELVFQDGDTLLARLSSGAEVKVTTTDVDAVVERLRRLLTPPVAESG